MPCRTNTIRTSAICFISHLPTPVLVFWALRDVAAGAVAAGEVVVAEAVVVEGAAVVDAVAGNP